VGEHVSSDCKTLYVRQSVWNGKEQDPKTENAVRDVDVCSDLAVMLKDYIGNRTNGFLFHADSGKPLLQRNILRDGLNPILTKLNLRAGFIAVVVLHKQIFVAAARFLDLTRHLTSHTMAS
jgi:hypothetical protein